VAGALSKAWAAAKLKALATGEFGLADDALLGEVIELLVEFTPEERSEIGAKAVELGADPAVITSFLNLVGGEVITVTSTAPRRGLAWWWILAALGAAGAGGYAVYRARRGRAGGR
jgi:hypothetical protein